MDPASFRAAGHALVDRVADLLDSLAERPVAPHTTPSAIRARLGDGRLPEAGSDPVALLDQATSLLFDNSTFNGHPRFFGYITASRGADRCACRHARGGGQSKLRRVVAVARRDRDRAPSRAVGRGVHRVSRVVRWPVRQRRQHGEHGLLPRRAYGVRPSRRLGPAREGHARGRERRSSRVYTSAETHTWVQKAAELFGLGGDAIRWIEVDDASSACAWIGFASESPRIVARDFGRSW